MTTSPSHNAPCSLSGCDRRGKHAVHGAGSREWVSPGTIAEARALIAGEVAKHPVHRDVLVLSLAGAFVCMRREAAMVLDAAMIGGPDDPAVAHTDARGVVDYWPRGSAPAGPSAEDDARAAADVRRDHMTAQIREHVAQIASLTLAVGPVSVQWAEDGKTVAEVLFAGAPVKPETWRMLVGAGFTMGERKTLAEPGYEPTGKGQDAADAGTCLRGDPLPAPTSASPSPSPVMLCAGEGEADGGYTRMRRAAERILGLPRFTFDDGRHAPVVLRGADADRLAEEMEREPEAAPMTPHTSRDDGQRVRNLAADLGLAHEARNAMSRALEIEKQATRDFADGFAVLGLRGSEKPADCARAWVKRAEQFEGDLDAVRKQFEATLAVLRLWKVAKLGGGAMSLEDVERALFAFADMRSGAEDTR